MSPDRLPRRRYAVAALVLLALDALWLGVVATPLYEAELGRLLAPEPDLLPAAGFYLLYVVAVVFFVVDPVLREGPGERGSWRRAAGRGAFLGLVAYATWGLTNAAVLRDWPLALVPVDLAWGALLTATTAAVTVAVTARSTTR